jgi:Siphovirus protein of unknown function (DUF859)
VVWTVDSQDISANTSTVTATLYFAKYNASYNAYNTGGFGLTFRVNTSTNYTETFDLRSGSVPEIENIRSRTVTVSHNADGTKSIVISASGDTESLGTISLSSTVALPTIPREAYVTNSVDFTVGNDIPLTITNDGNQYVQVLLYVNGVLKKTVNAGQVTSYTIEPTSGEEDTFYSEIPNATSCAMYVRIKTYSDSGYTTQIGVDKDKTGTMYIDTVANKPTFTTFAMSNVDKNVVVTDKYANELVTSSTATLLGSSDKLIKGYSKARATIAVANKAVALNSATMSSYTFTNGSKTNSGAFSSGSDVTIDIDNVNQVIGYVTAIDSRNLFTTASDSVGYLANYFNVNIWGLTLARTNGIEDETTLSFEGLFFKEYFGGGTDGVLNAITCHYRYKETTESWGVQSWNSITASSDGSGNITFSSAVNGDLGASGFDPDKSFNIEVRIFDKLSQVIIDGVLPVGTPVLHLTKSGLAVGGVFDADLNALQVTGGIALDGVDITADAGEINKLNGLTSDTGELNILDGVTATYSELNITDNGQTTEKVLNVQCKCRAYLSSAQDNLAQTNVKVLLDAETYDIGGDFDTANSRFVAPVSGYYLIVSQVGFKSVVTAKRYQVDIFVNGSTVCLTMIHSGLADNLRVQASAIEYVPAGQYIELYATQLSGGTTVDLINSTSSTFMAIHLLSI